MKKVIWICDHCQINKVTHDDYLPDGWITDTRFNPSKHYHQEKCLLAELTPKERENYNNSIAMA